MFKSSLNALVASVLVVTQVAACNASALFLCLEPDGSVCLDLGPQSCRCCHEEAPGDAHRHDGSHRHGGAECAEHGCTHHEPSGQGAPGIPVESAQAADDTCPCKHIQVSEPQTATLVRAIVLPDTHQMVIPLIEPAATCGLTFGCQCAAVALSPDWVSTAQAELSSVVLRC